MHWVCLQFGISGKTLWLIEDWIAEDKLRKLSHQPRVLVSSHSSRGDSGYASFQPPKSFHDGLYDGSKGLSLNEDSEDGDDGRESAEYGSDTEQYSNGEEEARVGQGLLWSNKNSRKHREENDQAVQNSSIARQEDTISPLDTSPSDSRMRLTPPTPSQESEVGALDLTTRRHPSNMSEVPASRRISFNTSVRISGGIRSHTHPMISHDLFSPTLNHATERYEILSTERTPLSLSANSSYRSPSTLQNHPSSSSLVPRSTSGQTSSAVSRSSSPCSSIYAPLQPPSKTCPSPSFVRTVPSPSKRSITFTEYLRGRSEEESDEESARGYRDLLAKQARRKKEEKRRVRIREDGLLWWEQIREMARSVTGTGRRGGSGNGGIYGATRDLHANGHGSRYVEEVASRGRPKSRTTKMARTASTLSQSSTEEAEEEEEEVEVMRVDKTEVDMVFGLAPRRWIKLDWIVWKTEQILKAVCDGLSTLWTMTLGRFSVGVSLPTGGDDRVYSIV